MQFVLETCYGTHELRDSLFGLFERFGCLRLGHQWIVDLEWGKVDMSGRLFVDFSVCIVVCCYCRFSYM